jgi:hypothetical protein
MKRNLQSKKILMAGALAVVSLLSVAASAAPSLILHSSESGNNYVAYNDLKTPAAADAYCKQKMGHLAVINTHAELIDIANLLKSLPISGAVTNQDIYFLFGESVPANQINPVTIIGQTYFSDVTYPYNLEPYLSSPVSFVRNLQLSVDGQSFAWSNLTSTTTKFVCEFEDAPI